MGLTSELLNTSAGVRIRLHVNQGNGVWSLVFDTVDDGRYGGAPFTQAGYVVITAPDGDRGLKLALERRPDVVVTDLSLPYLSGAELIDALRAAGEQVPVVLMSGSVDGTVTACRCHAFNGGSTACPSMGRLPMLLKSPPRNRFTRELTPWCSTTD